MDVLLVKSLISKPLVSATDVLNTQYSDVLFPFTMHNKECLGGKSL